MCNYIALWRTYSRVQMQHYCYLRGHRLGGELVPLLSLLIIQQHHSVSRANGEFAVIWCPGHARHFGNTSILLYQRKNAKNSRTVY